MKIYKFLMQDGWPVLITAENKAKAKYALYRLAQDLSNGFYRSFIECMPDFSYAGIIGNEEAKALILAEDCDADFDIEDLERGIA